jgi:hypothetical protein
MRRRVLEFWNAAVRFLAVPSLVLAVGIGSAMAQSAPPNGQDQGKPGAANASDGNKENQRRKEEFIEAQQTLNGPAGNPECVWLGRLFVNLMWNHDLDTAFRNLDLYDRFGCPGGHVQASFRCLTRFADQIDPKVQDSLNRLVHACWINPNAQPQTAAAATPAAAPSTAGNAAPAPAASAAPQPSPSPAAPAK